MIPLGEFTRADRTLLYRASRLAETLTLRYFGLPQDEWARNPYGIFTRKEIVRSLHKADGLATVVQYGVRGENRRDPNHGRAYGIVLNDPNILQALLRASGCDLWTLGLFILTHELTHIVRFRRFGVDFCAPVRDRDEEEVLVQEVTREILEGVANTDEILRAYDSQPTLPIPRDRPNVEEVYYADLRVPV